MREIKVGEKLLVKYKTTAESKKFDGKIVEVESVHIGQVNPKRGGYIGITDGFGGIYFDELLELDGTPIFETLNEELVKDKNVKVIKTIMVKQNGLIVQHAVGSKKRRIVISTNIKIDDIDTLITMLKLLKEEVSNA